jgi:uncharacterized linocin/CFP29 family protein
MDLLKREFAPILPDAWKAIDDEATRVLKLHLAGRKVVDFSGPHGWKHAAVNTGRLRLLAEHPAEGVSVGIRLVQPLVELRTPIRLDIMDLDSVARGAHDPDLRAVVVAAEKVARTEDAAIFNGYKHAGVTGILEVSPHPPITIADPSGWPAAVVAAKEILRTAGVGGPYALALGRKEYDEISAANEDGYPVRKHLERQIVDGPIVWAPAIKGAVLLSVRGNDYELTVGQDLSIGYAFHERHTVELYLTESFTFRVLEPAAAIALHRA